LAARRCGYFRLTEGQVVVVVRQLEPDKRGREETIDAPRRPHLLFAVLRMELGTEPSELDANKRDAM
jgi:hypothetical protein